MTEAVLITGLGVVSPLGVAAPHVAARLCGGESALRPLNGLGCDVLGATVDEIPLEAVPAEKRAHIGRLDRLCRLFLSAAHLAVADARLHDAEVDAERLGLSFGTGLGCLLTNAEYNQKLVEHGPSAASPRLFAYTVSSAAAGEVSIALGIKGPNVTAHAGLAAGLQAIGYGFDLIRAGKADVVVAGGADALGAALVHGLADMGLLRTRAAVPFGEPVTGVCPSEGAAIVVLERAGHAQRRGAQAALRIDGYAAGFEPTLTRRDRACTGIAETIGRALALTGHAASEVGLVMASAQGGALDAVELAGLQRVFGRDAGPLVMTPKVAWGETFGAGGALALALAATLWQEPVRFADTVAFDLAGRPLSGAVAQARLRSTQLALVHSLCYSGPTVTLLLSRDQ